MKFKTRMINAAVAAALGTVAGAAIAGAAMAVNLGADGQGQVSIQSTCTVPVPQTAMPMPTYLSIINSDSLPTKAVKVRFLNEYNQVALPGRSDSYIGGGMSKPGLHNITP